MDGNFSAKRLNGSGSTDPRTFESDYFIPGDDIEHFKKNAAEKQLNTKAVTCSSNWSGAKATEEDTVKVFKQTGIFVLACRHGFMECIAEMKQSGELVKYGLAAVKQIIDFCGNDNAIGHDIGCTSRVTVANSDLGERAREAGCRVVINAFHGFAHNRLCQLQNHLLYLLGFGNEDLETCKQIFSSSNSCAPLIRHASYFHWKQFLDLHFDQWDMDKYLELSKFFALGIIKSYSVELTKFKVLTNFGDEDFETWHQEELAYLKDCASEPTATSVSVVYVVELQKLQFAEKMYASVTQAPFLSYTASNFTPESGLNYVSRQCSNSVSAKYSSARRKYELQLNVVEHFEQQNSIQSHWSPQDPEYLAVEDYARHHAFIRVVEELEGLVVQRLFELCKANLVGTGYKMRKHISKALACRSATIRTALDRYNKLAPRQKPSRLKLEYSDVIGYSALGKFSLLKVSHADILVKPWAQPANREMAMKYFKILWSKEEILCLNIEVQCLVAWIVHHEKQLLAAEEKFRDAGADGLAAEMRLFYAERHRVNSIHRQLLHKIYMLDGYSGQRHEDAGREELRKQADDGDDEGDGDEEEEEGVVDAMNLRECLERATSLYFA
ncbi:hypothetical protein JVT61DRAFT_12162 [Boletus reticuloceps]|uniref:Uncharacterized protein n=1 Tax=Boletus reticuloceps TaxID=495285 RepID=A0A8I3A4L7_9AGAM|nr:hypothetical protein JVT61DRAFT_12162 [Boletus reticuloceps]